MKNWLFSSRVRRCPSFGAGRQNCCWTAGELGRGAACTRHTPGAPGHRRSAESGRAHARARAHEPRERVYAPLLLLQEANVPTWAGVAQMLGAGVCAFLLGALSSERTRTAWWLVAAGLTLLSMDDATSLHERAAEYFDPYALEPLFYGPFVVLLLAGLYLVRADLRRRSVTAGPFVLAGLTMLAAAVVPGRRRRLHARGPAGARQRPAHRRGNARARRNDRRARRLPPCFRDLGAPGPTRQPARRTRLRLSARRAEPPRWAADRAPRGSGVGSTRPPPGRRQCRAAGIQLGGPLEAVPALGRVRRAGSDHPSTASRARSRASNASRGDIRQILDGVTDLALGDPRHGEAGVALNRRA